ncbi:nucleotide exchange factor GrpE [Mycoplasma sp. ES3157-GEN-MYC]|uniref:Protein GrpE n=1 Tax=Mycoplasma miroungigenitalium TaxID=754515 RepID=A0A6M4JE75_9MOLU|nr:nucleotide exchange factor GrpE [Mycoplasma miroungigenitalium]MBU4690283.1 nucleotide exchange factor GrpE [Mycoplasma miroungigenitalium]MBU4691550.1 nucleotide exchange factor GrpE [Mycoplasma miroungigenitalium]QJR43382.1 nucleotide exchange factor GrpE [Mycoplasma miroungigenitalium]
MRDKDLKSGTIIKTNIKVFEGKKFIKKLSRRNFLIKLGENSISSQIDDLIMNTGWAPHYKIIVTFDENAKADYAKKTLSFEIENLSFESSIKFKKDKEREQKTKELENVKKELADSKLEFKLLADKFFALEEINNTLKDKIRELNNKINENKRITVPEEEIKRIKEYALQKFFEDFTNPFATLKLAVESGLNSADNSVKTYVSGFKMVLGMLESVFSSHGLKTLLPKVGDIFDPNTQKPIDFVIDPDAEPNTIKRVDCEAYLLNDRVIKYALVVVSKKE